MSLAEELFRRHERAALQCSGGKDSLACLYLMRAYWNRVTVMWVNTGAAFPETIALMQQVRAMVPYFLEVKSDQPAHIARFGPPADLIPAWNTELGRWSMPERVQPVQSPFSCCGDNIWAPAAQAVRELGATLVIRGQRIAERRRTPVRSGYVEGGIEYYFPIEEWTDEAVRDYLHGEGVPLPAHYEYVNTSLDCWSCTAYLDENAGKLDYMREHHPVLYGRLQQQFKVLAGAIADDLDALDRVME